MSDKNVQPVRVAIAGVGNCASALIQGITYYKDRSDEACEGIMVPEIGGRRPSDIEIVCAFDIDKRKVGFPLNKAIFAEPNNARVFAENIPDNGIKVSMAPVMDGVAAHMADYPEDRSYRISTEEPVDIAEQLANCKAEVLVCYLPVGSELAVRHFAEACLKAGVAMVNCMPVFIASNPEWAQKFVDAGLPIIGDDIKSQFGATIVHRSLVNLFKNRGCKLENTYQLNTGGNTDFLNMLERERLASKKQSKTQSVQSQLAVPMDPDHIHIGPSDYVPWQKDNKIAFIRLEGSGFGGVELEMELRLSVQDSPNSAGVVIDAIRCLQLARERGISGPLTGPCAAYMKSPPEQMEDTAAFKAVNQFITQE